VKSLTLLVIHIGIQTTLGTYSLWGNLYGVQTVGQRSAPTKESVDINNFSHKLVSVTSSFFLYQVIKEPTRHDPSGSSSTIDLAFISPHIEFNTAITIPPLSTSDHQGIKLSIDIKTCHAKAKSSSRRTIWLYSKADINKACDMIDDTDWDQIFSNNSDITKEKEPSLAFHPHTQGN